MYNPNNGEITIPETAVWTLTISVGSNKENAFLKALPQSTSTAKNLSGSEIRTYKKGVYLIFWNVRVNGMSVESLISKRIKHYLDNGSNLVILRHETNDIVTLEIDD